MENVFLDILELISQLLTEQNKTQKELCDFIGINGNVFTAWKSGRNKSYTKHLSKIAEFFGVSVDYLLGKEKSHAVAGLKEKHMRLITAYDRAEAPIQEAVDRLLQIDDKPVVVKIAARDGSFQERVLTETEWKKLQDLPDENEDL